MYSSHTDVGQYTILSFSQGTLSLSKLLSFYQTLILTHLVDNSWYDESCLGAIIQKENMAFRNVSCHFSSEYIQCVCITFVGLFIFYYFYFPLVKFSSSFTTFECRCTGCMAFNAKFRAAMWTDLSSYS